MWQCIEGPEALRLHRKFRFQTGKSWLHFIDICIIACYFRDDDDDDDNIDGKRVLVLSLITILRGHAEHQQDDALDRGVSCCWCYFGDFGTLGTAGCKSDPSSLGHSRMQIGPFEPCFVHFVPLEAARGRPETARRRLRPLEAARGRSMLLDAARCCSMLLEAARFGSKLRRVPTGLARKRYPCFWACSKALLDAARCCSKLLDSILAPWLYFLAVCCLFLCFLFWRRLKRAACAHGRHSAEPLHELLNPE